MLLNKISLKILIAAILALTLCAFTNPVNAQASRTYSLDFGTVANSVTETQYLSLDGWAKIDSISFSYAATGEIDVDSVDIYVGYAQLKTALSSGWYGSTAYTFTSTLNIAAAAKSYALLTSSNATLITGAVLRGVNALKIVTRGATSGCDATDPDRLIIIVQVWGTKS